MTTDTTPTVEQAIQQLVSALVESKSWLRGYADAVIRDAIDQRGDSPAMSDERADFEAWIAKEWPRLATPEWFAGDDGQQQLMVWEAARAAIAARPEFVGSGCESNINAAQCACEAARPPEPTPVALSDALAALRELEAMVERYRPPGYPIPDAQKRARAMLASKPVAPAEPVTDAQIMEITREFAKDGGRWPSDWINAARAVLALRQPAESAQEAGK